MKMTRRLVRAGAVLCVALAAGHLVQTMQEGEARPTAGAAKPEKIEKVSAGAEAVVPKADPLLPAGAALAEPVAPPADVPAAKTPPTPPETALAALSDEAPPLLPPVGEPPVAPALATPAAPAAEVAPDCTPKLALTAAPQAMLKLNLAAPCHSGQRVVLRHAGLAVAETLDAGGKLALDLPALDAAGKVSVLFHDATIATAAVAVPTMAQTRRFAVQWLADDAFQLHAMENGASYGQPGHVSAEAPVSPDGGYVVALGDPSLDLPMMAQVYTWPADPAVTAVPVIEAAVTELTCGRELLGETLHAANGSLTVAELTLAMPECDAVGDILVLNNPVPEQTLAAAN